MAHEPSFYIRSLLNGKVLDVSRADPNVGTPVVMYARKPKPALNQLWYLGTNNIVYSRLNGLALKNNGGVMTLAPYDPHSSQRWAQVGNKIVNLANQRRCLDIAGASNSDGTNVIPYDYKSSANQHWAFDTCANMTFRIRSCLNGNVLDVQGGQRSSGTPVIVWPAKAGANDNQLWYFGKDNVIHSKLNGFALQNIGGHMCLLPYNPSSNQRWALCGKKIINLPYPHRCIDIEGASRAKGAKLIPYDFKGSDNQHWEIDFV